MYALPAHVRLFVAVSVGRLVWTLSMSVLGEVYSGVVLLVAGVIGTKLQNSADCDGDGVPRGAAPNASSGAHSASWGPGSPCAVYGQNVWLLVSAMVLLPTTLCLYLALKAEALPSQLDTVAPARGPRRGARRGASTSLALPPRTLFGLALACMVHARARS